jgi:outer membrane receptor protein involved in Fe transport
MRLRGGFNRASRAPNLGELFLNVQEIFTIGGNFGDPCGLRTNAPYGAAGGIDPGTGNVALDPNVTGTETAIPQLAPGQTQAGANSAYLICRAMMGTTGGTAFYTQNQTAPGAGGGFAWVLQQGNPELDSEKANTVTAGFVFSSTSANPWLSRITATLDWWKVDIKDAIQQYSTDYASWRCFGAVTVGSTAEAQAQAASRACTNVARNQSNGNQVTTLLEYDNQATIKTSGIDATFNWYAPFADIGLESVPGGLSFGTILGWTDYYKTKQSQLAFDVETDWAGSLGPNLTGTNPGAYKWRANTFLGYNLGKLGVNLRWNYLSSVVSAGQASEKAIKKNNAAVAADPSAGIILGYTPSTAYKVPSYSSFGLSMNWEFTEKLSLRAGVDNLLDTSPKVTAKNAGRPYDESLSQAQNLAALAAVCSAADQALGCQDPTGFSLASSGAGTTSAGFYDTMGRRYFVGVKAKF